MKTVKDAVKEFNGAWPIDTKNTNYWFAGSLSNMHYEVDGVLKHVCSKKEFEDYAKEQDEKPVYTQEMADNGELPPVGCECTLQSIGFTLYDKGVQITYIGDGVGCYKDNDKKEFTFNISDTKFIPIDTRTDEEKLVDEMENLITEHCDSNGTLRDLPRTFLEHYDITPK